MAYVDLNVILNPSPGVPLPAAYLDQVRDNFDFLVAGTPRCRASVGTPQTINRITGTAINFTGGDSWDVGPIHAAASSRFVAPINGIYTGVAFLVWATDTRGFRRIIVRANGSTDVCALKDEPEGTDQTDQTLPWEIYLSIGDYVELIAYYDSASGPSSLNVLGASFTMRWVGSA